MKQIIKSSIFLLLALILPAIANAHDFEVDGIFYNINGNKATVTYKGSSYNSYSGSVTIPSTVTYGGTTYSVTSIGYQAFSGCSGLTSINIPNSVTYIDHRAFYGCSGLTNVTIPNSVTSIGSGAFSGCSGLTSISVDNGNSKYDSRNNCNAIIETASNNLVFGCRNTTIPNSVTSIGSGAFSGCTGLTSINIPNSVTAIGNQSFYGCTWLTSISVDNGNSKYDSRDNCNAIIETASNRLVIGCRNTTIPNSVTSIGNFAFYGCSGLTSINIPNSVTAIGDYAFSGCSGLTSISVDNGNSKYDSRNNCNAIIITAYDRLIIGCRNTTIPNSVTSIGDYAFDGCTGLTSIDIPNSVSEIGNYAFDGCTGLTSIDIPNSVTSIGDDAFNRCTGLTNVNIGNSVTSIGNWAFQECTGLTSISVDNGNSIYDSRNNCNAIIITAYDRLIKGCMNTTIPNSVTSIGDFAFYGCSGLTSINIPNSVTSIGADAFEGCTGLTSIDIPNSVTSIGEWAFAGCFELTSINIGNSVTSIGYSAFYGCNNMTNVYCYAANPPTCFENTFETYSATLHVPASSLAAYFTAPYWCNFENIIGDAVVPTAINISKDSVDLLLTDQIELTATVTPANASNKVISWHSTNTGIATVDNGNVTAIGIGECDIIATCFGMQDTCHITVTNPIKLDQQEAMLLPNHILTLTPTAPAVPEGYTASSSDPTVAAARVMNGKVQVVGIKEGTTTITVGSNDGLAIPATCLVTVYTELGDLNSDGFVTISDVTALIDYLLGGEVNPFNSGNADVNGDQALTITDMTALIDLLLSGND